MNPILQWAMGIAGALIVAFLLYVVRLVAGKADEAKMTDELNTIKETARDLEREFRAHLADRQLHIDPLRDERRFSEFQGTVTGRFDRLDEKIEKLMIAMPQK